MTLRNAEASTPDVDSRTAGERDQGRFRIYVLRPCSTCEHWIRSQRPRCPECRGEGRVKAEVAECPNEASLGLTLVTLGREGEFDDCPIGILDLEGEVGQKWIVRPWLPSPRNKSDAARVLASKEKGENDG